MTQRNHRVRTSRFWNISGKQLLGVATLACLLLMSAVAPRPAEAQIRDDLLRIISKIDPSVTRHLSNRAKGEIGEGNIEYGIRHLAGNADEFLELEARFLHRSALSKGIDSIYFTAKRTRFHIVEAKATSHEERLTLSLLNKLRSGARQMDDVWVRHNLDRLYREAQAILADPSAAPALRASAQRAVNTVKAMQRRSFVGVEKTVVVTRLRGVDAKYLNQSRKFYDSVASDVFSVVDNVVEVNRNGNVLAVYARGAPRTH